ncbi:MAG: complement resistance protein TraT [Proteobacteria bacterium]|nr:complement resistance protein TraT [Pseudomonadota bacterium]
MQMMQKNKKVLNTLKVAVTGAIVMQITSCAAISTAIHHGSLKTQSKMSQSIFLDPISDKDKTIYVQVKDTTGQDVDLKKTLTSDLASKGWAVTNDIDKAHNMVQVNVLQVGKAPNVQSVWQSMNSGFGNALLGGLAGVASGFAADSVGVGLGVGAGVGAVGWLADQMVEDVTYSMITDVQVSVKTDGTVTQTTQSNLSQGTQTNTTQTYNQKTNWLRYRTRIASVADQVNLDFKDAKPVLVKEVANEIAGIMG